MKAIAFNGSPRKEWNTATLLRKALEGASSQGAETELVDLYDVKFKGCWSCFECKLKGGKSYGKCAVRDDLTPILAKVKEADAIILGSPVFLGTATGEMRSFMERLIFPYLTYTDPPGTLLGRKIHTAFIHTMNMNEEQMKAFGFDLPILNSERLLKIIFGHAETLLCFDTFQFEDYSKFICDRFDPEKKAARRRDVFPKDCEKAFELGARLVRRDAEC